MFIERVGPKKLDLLGWKGFIDWVVVLCPAWHQICHFRDIPQANWLGMEKLNLTQQKHAFTNQKMYNNTKYTKKSKARFSRLLCWKRKGSILVLVLYKFVTYLLT